MSDGFAVAKGAVTYSISPAQASEHPGFRDDVLQVARRKARESSVEHICSFTQSTQERGDIIISLDAFEHFAEPADVLRVMDTMLRPEGEVVVASFEPTWHHPLGGHLFSVFPWAHLLLSDEGLIRWWSGLRQTGPHDSEKWPAD